MRTPRSFLLPTLILSLILPLTAAAQLAPAPAKWTGKPGPAWKEFDKAVADQKFEEAAGLVEKRLAAARKSGDVEDQVRGLVRWTRLRMALHGYETAVRFLKEQPWPDDPLARMVLDLYYSHSLVQYASMYSWEIQQREKIDTKGAVDLKAWTLEQIYGAALAAYAEVWTNREALGRHPAGFLTEFLDPNTYPEGVRPTLRDATSYLLVELLADTTGWRPEDSNEVFRLDLGKLLADPGKETLTPSLTDAALHPLVRLVYVLKDLEQWHADSGRREAAFEAKLERFRRLHASFTEAPDRERIRQALVTALPAIRDRPWWASGMATLAGFVREEDSPDHNRRARDLAEQGRAAYPDSIGGRQCLSTVKSIEAPQYAVHAMASDGPDRRSIGVDYKNLRALHFRAWPMDLKKQIENTDEWDVFPSWRVIEKFVSGSKPAAEWSVELPETTDFEIHRQFVTPPMREPGFYIIVSSARPDFGRADNVRHAVPMVVGDLVMLTRQESANLEVTVVSGSTGKPVPGVDVYLYRHDWRNRHRVADDQETDDNGTIRFHVRNQGESHFLFAKSGNQVAIDPNYFSAYRENDPGETAATLLYTDRSIYRPGQKVFFKAVLYKGRWKEARYRTSPATAITVTLMDANYQAVEAKPVVTNDFGTASGEFVIPAGRLLGQWRLVSSHNGTQYLRVEEYKRPTFETKLVDPETPMRLNQPAKIKGEVKYYFGLPVTNGTVKWRVTRQPVYPWWWDWYGFGGMRAVAQTVAIGTTPLKEDGTFEVAFTPQADERTAATSKDVSYAYRVVADATDEGGETRSAERSFRLGFVAVEASVDTRNGFLIGGKESEITIRRTDLDGTPAKGTGKWRLVAIQAPSGTLLPADQPMPAPRDDRFRTPGDRLRPRWEPGYQPMPVIRQWPDGAEKATGTVDHDAKGEGKVTLPGLKPGAWRLKYETMDPYGAKYETFQDFVVAGTRTDLALPALLLAERSSVPVGETARVLILSGLKDQPMFLDLYRDGRRIERKTLDSSKDANLFEFPVTESDRGGFGVTLVAVRDHQFVQQSAAVFVPWTDRELKVEFATFRDRLRPGQAEKWSVKVTPAEGKDALKEAAELLAYMYDRSLDTFAPHNPPSPLALMPYRAGTGWLRASLAEARQIWVESDGFAPVPPFPALLGDRLKVFDSYPMGGPGNRYGWHFRGGVGGEAEALPAAPPCATPAPEQAARAERADKEVTRNSRMLKTAEDVSTVSRDRIGKSDGFDDQPNLEEDGRGPGAPAVQVRSNFAETAFWQPHLLTGPDGSATIEFSVPDSVTSWNVFVHAVTRDLKSGFVKKEARTVKDLMVRPYLPRFLREGDEATLKVVVNNASDKELKGTLTLDVQDPGTGASVASSFGLKASDLQRPFAVAAGGGTNVEFAVKAPPKVGTVAFKVVAVSGEWSDGELRPIPVLPGRMHLAQSRFVVLKDASKKTMRFEDLAKGDDATLLNEQMVVTLDAQLFYSVLSAVPYLVNYPYECTEQTLNRFLSTGILSSMYKDYPAVGAMAKEFSKRKTRLESWDAADPNRKMALEETPWVRESKGGEDEPDDLVNVLDPAIAKAQRESSLAKLRKSQTSSGGFPWFPGGPPSPYMTAYLLYGFAKGVEFGVDVPKDVVSRAWAYLHRHYVDEMVKESIGRDCCWEFVTFVNFVLSSYPDATWTGGVFTDAERKRMLDFSFKHWKDHAPYVKGQLALTLKRMGREEDGRKVWASVMDSAKTTEDQGTFWAPEDRGWLWYNDTIETHAFALRTLMELKPDDGKLDGLVLWLLLNKKLGHWKSTRATSEVVYSLASYLKKTGQLGVREEATVEVGGQKTTFEFLPDRYTGKKNQIVIPGEKVDAQKTSTVVVEKGTPGYLFASATWHFSTERMPAEDRGDYLKVSRQFFKRENTGREFVLTPLKEGAVLAPGDELEVQISLRSKAPMDYVHLRDPRGAGFEPGSANSRHRWDLGIYWYEEIRDSGTNFFFERLPQGEYTFKYRIRAATAGRFKVGPATVQPMYAPEFTAYSAGAVLGIGGK